MKTDRENIMVEKRIVWLVNYTSSHNMEMVYCSVDPLRSTLFKSLIIKQLPLKLAPARGCPYDTNMNLLTFNITQPNTHGIFCQLRYTE